MKSRRGHHFRLFRTLLGRFFSPEISPTFSGCIASIRSNVYTEHWWSWIVATERCDHSICSTQFPIADIADRHKSWKVRPYTPAHFLNFANSCPPVLTFLLVVIVWYIFSTTEDLAQQKIIIQSVIDMASTAVLFWFSDRAMRTKKWESNAISWYKITIRTHTDFCQSYRGAENSSRYKN